MNVKLLIDAIVRQTMALIAQLATASGGRTPLAHVANKVFLDLVEELERQGLRRKVVADMFGLALRSYQKRVQRLTESATDEGRTLWEAVLGYLQDGEVVARTDVMRRFRFDDEAMVKGILADLVDTGLVFKTGAGPGTAYRAARDNELDLLDGAGRGEGVEAMVWLTVYRQGPLDRSALGRALRLSEDDVDAALGALTADGRVIGAREDATDEVTYASPHYVTTAAQQIGWEAAVADHFQALVSTLGQSLRKDADTPHASAIGGSTYSFDLWPGHPFEGQILGLLGRVRDEATALRKASTAHADQLSERPDPMRVTFYVGQTVAQPGSAADTDDD